MRYLMLPSPNRCAVLDLGTNIFHLLIVEIEENQIDFKVIYKEKIAVKIGKGGISQGIIDQEAQKRITQAFTRFASTMQTYHVPPHKVFATATSAFRNAKNGQNIAQEIFQNFGISINIIKGTEEAAYIYEGVRQAVPLKGKLALIMDIGGGSVEFILGNDHKIFWKQSFEIGGQRLLDQFMRTDPISQLDLQRMEIYLETALLELTKALFNYTPQILVGSAGAFETLVAMAQHLKEDTEAEIPLTDEHGELIQKAVRIEKDDFYKLYQKIVSANLEERKAIQGMLELRADMIVVAVALIKFILEKINVQHFVASAYSLKEGVLFSKILAGKEQD